MVAWKRDLAHFGHIFGMILVYIMVMICILVCTYEIVLNSRCVRWMLGLLEAASAGSATGHC